MVFRPGAIEALPEELDALGVRRPMVIAGKRAAGAFRKIIEGRLGVLDVPEHSSVEVVERIADIARKERVDGFVALGGGSASDTAKAAAILLAEGGRLEDHANHFTPPSTLHIPELKAPKLPIVAVPSTASAAEVTPGLGVRCGNKKLIFMDPKVAARVILLDPQANLSVPAALMLTTGMNGLAHCIEGLSGLVLLNARTCLHHAICHVLGSATRIAHGAANSVMLPHVIAFNHSPYVQQVRELQAQTGVPRRLRDLGVQRESLPEVARIVMGERGVYFNPRPVQGPQEVENLLQEAW